MLFGNVGIPVIDAAATMVNPAGDALGGGSLLFRGVEDVASDSVNLGHIGGLEDCLPITAQRLANGLGADLNASPIFTAAGQRNIIGIQGALDIIESNSNMIVVDPVRLGSADAGQYAVFEGNHIMHAEVSESGINIFDSSLNEGQGGFVTGARLDYLKQAGAYQFKIGK